MDNLLNFYKQKLNEETQALNELRAKTQEIEKKVNNLRKFAISMVGISFIANFIGYMLLSSPVVIISLIMLLAIAPFGFRIIDLDSQVDENKKKMEEHENKVLEYQDEIERIYSRKEVLDLINSRQTKVNNQTVVYANNTQEKDKINSR